MSPVNAAIGLIFGVLFLVTYRLFGVEILIVLVVAEIIATRLDIMDLDKKGSGKDE